MWLKNSRPVITIEKLYKSFRIPTEKSRSLRDRFTQLKFRQEYRTLTVFNNVNLTVNQSEWLGIIGVNGSGKSTLLRLINGIYEPDNGQIKVVGKIVPFLELGVGFNPELSAADNVFLNGTILGMTRKEIKAKFKQIVDFAGVEEFVNLKLKNFSTGMHVRLGFSVAMHTPGDIFLLDEVLAVGDYQFQRKTTEVFTKMRRSDKTVIYVSHDIKSVIDYCDRVIWLDKGRIMAEGKPKTVIKSYLQAQA